MQPYQQTDTYKRSHKLDPVTRQPVFPLRLIEQRQAGEKQPQVNHQVNHQGDI